MEPIDCRRLFTSELITSGEGRTRACASALCTDSGPTPGIAPKGNGVDSPWIGDGDASESSAALSASGSDGGDGFDGGSTGGGENEALLKRRMQVEGIDGFPVYTAKPATELATNDALDTELQDLLPFALTGAQTRAIEDIRQDLERPVPMHRLLQGDVGSGKTAVALAALLQCLRHGLPAAFMAPTELLAEQHHRTLSSLLGDRFTVHLCTGSRSVAERRTAADAATAGRPDLFVGTQALLSEHLGLQDAGLVVVDEQHRFGVRQRALLRRAEVRTPHLLVMTATPIPRSLALTHYGDLDVSILDELPPGRTPIRTVAMHASKMDAALARVGERVQDGEQAYIVVPAIEPGERGDPNLEELVPRLQQGPLADVPFGVVHGRLDRSTRDDTMAAFRDGSLRVLVATTVIEVGVDVPNASLMVILGADRFGLAQLHQLRGRVGRGAAASTCVLVADPATEDGKARLEKQHLNFLSKDFKPNKDWWGSAPVD